MVSQHLHFKPAEHKAVQWWAALTCPVAGVVLGALDGERGDEPQRRVHAGAADARLGAQLGPGVLPCIVQRQKGG